MDKEQNMADILGVPSHKKNPYTVEVNVCMSCNRIKIVYCFEQPCIVASKDGKTVEEGSIKIRVCSKCTSFTDLLRIMSGESI